MLGSVRREHFHAHVLSISKVWNRESLTLSIESAQKYKKYNCFSFHLTKGVTLSVCSRLLSLRTPVGDYSGFRGRVLAVEEKSQRVKDELVIKGKISGNSFQSPSRVPEALGDSTANINHRVPKCARKTITFCHL